LTPPSRQLDRVDACPDDLIDGDEPPDVPGDDLENV